jgi:hypothetical protein
MDINVKSARWLLDSAINLSVGHHGAAMGSHLSG